MKVTELITTIKAIEAKKQAADFKIFNLLKFVHTDSSWKEPDFYDCSTLKKYASEPFGVFIRDVFGYSISWFENMENILNLRNGKVLLYRYGYQNMVSYLNSTPEERKLILKKACDTDGVKVSFRNIKNNITPRKARRAKTKDADVKKIAETTPEKIIVVKNDVQPVLRSLLRESSVELDEANERIEKLILAVATRDNSIRILQRRERDLLRENEELKSRLPAPSFFETVVSGLFGREDGARA